ncbi:laminin B domain-containing protein [Spirosoma utsteinense]|uniref:Laminin IV type A domain-containing protein n=1 Tax=Spirosoma utsteinense TaxID=2585773 RepID=A0ABR6W606_9BACT|nr:laminin B domain-containing protein [Spirosoma utsteinense]MBC3785807.1 hypothetical protein [Spirosoma utsteinense]MBC3791979.1 hypothetical protein [Spirosoma utsteinense]
MAMFSKLEKFAFYKWLLPIGVAGAMLTGCSEYNEQSLPWPYVNRFDVNDQGWRVNVIQPEVGSAPVHSKAGGNRDGYIYAFDQFTTFWYFIASQAFVTEARKSYNRTLRFDLKQLATDAPLDGNDILLTNGIDTLRYNTNHHPGTTWTSYSVRMNELSGWKKGSSPATKADIQTVLQNLTDLRIRGEYRTGADTCGLDNAMIY